METLKSCPFCGAPGSLFASSNHSHAWEGGCTVEDCAAFGLIWEDTEAEAEAIAAWNRRAAVEQAAGAVPEGLIALGKTIAAQDNRATDAPIFIVQQKRSYVTEEGYNDSRYEWRETESGDYSGPDDEELVQLDKFYANEGHEPKGWKRYAIMDVWEFVTACFTEQGCKDYIAINGHNLKEPRIYAEGSFRNEEFRSLRKMLIALAASPSPLGREAGSSDYLVPCAGGGVTQPLSMGKIVQIARDAQIAYCLDKFPTYDEALVRAVEAAHGINPGSATREDDRG